MFHSDKTSKFPAEKRGADLQWRIVHSAITTNKYKAHFDSNSENCHFCGASETPALVV